MPRFANIITKRLLLKGPLYTEARSSPNQWAGITALNTGAATATVSTTVVDSDSLILLTAYAVSNIASGIGRSLKINSINPANAFVIGTSDGQNTTVNLNVAWFVWRTQ